MSWRKGFKRHLENELALIDCFKVLLDWFTMTLGFVYLSATSTDLQVHIPNKEVISVSLILAISAEVINGITTSFPRFFMIICFFCWFVMMVASLIY